MPLSKSMVGLQGSAATDTLEDRWVMNYAASVADTNPVYFDNRGSTALPAHPAYVSHLEWNAISLLHAERLTEIAAEERILGVHTFNSTQLHRPLVAGDYLSARATVVGLEHHRAGAKLTIRIDTVDAAGDKVATSYTSTIYRGVEADGQEASPEIRLKRRLEQTPPVLRQQDIEITRLAPFVFSECARDYGPIHTDIKVATAAGLPGLILHGTGTIAYILSAITNHEAGGNPRKIRGFQARLSDMVLCPSTIRLRVLANDEDDVVRFDVLTEMGTPAITDGVALLEKES